MPSIPLVFTVALKKELPLDWLKKHQIPVMTLAAASSGALHSFAKHPRNDVLFLLTGVGKQNAIAAAKWIAETIQVTHVVNLGSAGSACHPSHTWLAASSVSTTGTQSRHYTLKPTPFFSPHIKEGGLLTSTDTPDNEEQFPLVDMEAYFQAQFFHQHSIHFSVLKFTSDSCNQATLQHYDKALAVLRQQIPDLLGFLIQNSRESISVIVPIHNRSERIVSTLESVFNQSTPPDDVIIVDDGSDDDLPTQLEPFSASIKLIRLSTNQGVSAARNMGAKAAEGKWLAFLDSDDHWAPKKLEKQIEHLKLHTYLSALQCEEIWIRNGVRVNAHKHHQKPEEWIWRESLERCLVTPSAILIRKPLFELLGGFDEKMLACEDYDLWLRLSRYHPVGLCPYPGVIKHGGHDDQLSQRFAAMDRFRVYALVKAFTKENDTNYRQCLLDILRKKTGILLLGASKRGYKAEQNAYQHLLNTVENPSALQAVNLDKLEWLLNKSPSLS